MLKFDDTKLYSLLKEENFHEIKSFLDEYGIDSVDRDGRTFLMSAIAEKKERLVEYLIKLGSNVNATDREGLTPLHFAAMNDDESIAKLLIKNNAKIDVQDDHGNTPLWRAVMRSNNKADIIGYLISLGADAEIKNYHGVSPSRLMKL